MSKPKGKQRDPRAVAGWDLWRSASTLPEGAVEEFMAITDDAMRPAGESSSPEQRLAEAQAAGAVRRDQRRIAARVRGPGALWRDLAMLDIDTPTIDAREDAVAKWELPPLLAAREDLRLVEAARASLDAASTAIEAWRIVQPERRSAPWRIFAPRSTWFDGTGRTAAAPGHPPQRPISTA